MIFEPTEKQKLFFESDADILLYAGGAVVSPAQPILHMV